VLAQENAHALAILGVEVDDPVGDLEDAERKLGQVTIEGEDLVDPVAPCGDERDRVTQTQAPFLALDEEVKPSLMESRVDPDDLQEGGKALAEGAHRVEPYTPFDQGVRFQQHVGGDHERHLLRVQPCTRAFRARVRLVARYQQRKQCRRVDQHAAMARDFLSDLS
jgi:hypothetical protein